MSSLDANIILRLLLRDIPDQTEKVIDLIKNSKPGSLIVEDPVLFECVWILTGNRYRLDRKATSELILQLVKIPQINCNRYLLERAIPPYVETANISFIDICLAIYAELNNRTPLLTFDKKLAKALPKTVNLL